MTTRKLSLPCILILIAVLLPLVTVSAKDKSFDAIVRHIERSYHVRRTRIPFLGVASFAVKFVRPAGVKSFQLATFDDQDFSTPINEAAFETTLRDSLEKGWQPLVRRRSHHNSNGGGERLYIYTKPDGKDFEVLTITIEARDAVVVEAKIDQAGMLKFMEKPEIMGISLAGSLTGKASLAGLLNGGLNGNSNSFAFGGSSNSDRVSNQLPADIASTPQSFNGAASNDSTANSGSGSRPVLHAKSNEESDPSLQPGSSGAASTRPYTPSKPPDKDTIHLDTRLVNLNIKATDQAGRALSNLKVEDFEVYEDGIKQEVAFFEPVSAPIHLVLLLDLSGSTKDERKVMVEATKKFIDTLGPKDNIAIAAFTREFFVVSDFTTDRKLLKSRVDKVKKIQGGTAYYDAMWTTLDLLREVKATRKAIVVMTDGIDNSLSGPKHFSTKHTFNDLLARASEEDVTIYPIDVGQEIKDIKLRKWSGRQIVIPASAQRQRPAEIAHEELAALAEQTAGKVFRATHERELDGVYQRVAAELHLLYSVAYDPKNTRNEGEFRKVDVKVNRDGVLARTRRGYYAK